MTITDLDPNDFLTVSQFAEEADVTRKTVITWIHTKRIPYTRTPGGHFRIRRAVATQMPMTADEFATLVGVSKRTVIRWCSLGFIKCWRGLTLTGTRTGPWLIPRDEIDHAIDQLETGAYRPTGRRESTN